MGVQVRLVVYAPDEATARRACTAAFARVAALEQILSDWRPDSELMRLCRKAGGPPMRVSRELCFVLGRAQQLSQRSGGAFDVSVGPYVALWRQARKSGRFPSAQELKSARSRVGWQKIRLDVKARRVRLTVSGMRLDLGGIAKGYAGDEALHVLKQHGITRALFEAGGDIVAGAAPPHRAGWVVRAPAAETDVATGPATRTLALANTAISTSGDWNQYVIFNGRRYSHVVDPRTGVGLTSRFAATIVARDGITSDGLSTAASVLGARRGAVLAQSFAGARLIPRNALRATPGPAIERTH